MLLNSDARSIPLADGCVQCVVTSPPYWGLRKYKGAMTQVFGGVAGCAHEWDTSKRDLQGAPGSSKQASNIGANCVSTSDSTCRLCGAWRGELGLEPTPEMFVEHIVEVFREVRRVLRDDGTCWLNLGDSYATHASKRSAQFGGDITDERNAIFTRNKPTAKSIGLKEKDLCGIPWAVAFALRDDGWYLRSDIIWSKPNPMPESLNGWRWEQHRVKVENSEHATKHDIRGGHKKMLEDASVHQGMSPEFLAKWIDCPGCPACLPNDGLVLRRGSWRPTKSHEYLFMLAKSDRYYADADAVREPHKEEHLSRYDYDFWPDGTKESKGGGRPDGASNTGGTKAPNPAGRNRRTVWQVDDKLNEFLKYAEAQGVDIIPLIDAFNSGQSEKKDVWHIATQPFKGAHFATFCEALVEPCIKAATSERGCCPACGSSWARVVEKDRQLEAHRNVLGIGPKTVSGGGDGTTLHHDITTTTLGFRPSCDCWRDMPAPILPRTKDNRKRYQQDMGDYWKIRAVCYGGKTKPALVLDPFCGSGTTPLVARKLGRRGVGTDLSLPYLRDQARKRLGLDKLAAWHNGGKEVETRLQGLPMWAECAE